MSNPNFNDEPEKYESDLDNKPDIHKPNLENSVKTSKLILQKELELHRYKTRYDFKFYSGDTQEAENDLTQVAKTYQEFDVTYYRRLNPAYISNDQTFSIPGGIICPRILVRETDLEGKIVFRKVVDSELSSDRALTKIVEDELKEKGWNVVKVVEEEENGK